jgi:hypothetical protein
MILSLTYLLKVLLDQLPYYIYFLGAFAFFVFAGIDYFYYNFYPLEAGVFIDACSRGREEFERYREGKMQLGIEGNNIFGIIYSAN